MKSIPIPGAVTGGDMRLNRNDMDFYLVTDSRLTRRSVREDVELAVAAGCGIVQYRVKDTPTRVMVEEARALMDICRGRALMLVNDRVDVALAAGADGVHIGQDDMAYADARRLLGPDAIIGVTVHDAAEASEATRLGADYLGLSPIFDTGTKADAGHGIGVDAIPPVRAITGLPIVAIGGINTGNTASVIRAGADAVAVVSAVVAADDPGAAVREFIRIVQAAK